MSGLGAATAGVPVTKARAEMDRMAIFLAVSLPAWRAAHVDPLVVLRAE